MTSKHYIIITALLSSCINYCNSQNLKSYLGVVKNSYNFWLFNPSTNSKDTTLIISHEVFQEFPTSNSKTYSTWAHYNEPHNKSKKPLIIFLHGASLCGKNIEMVRKYGTIDALSKGLKIDSYILAPQNPGGAWSPEKIDRLIDWTLNNYQIDTMRIYVLGMSLGGYGTIDYAAERPHRVAAAMGLCGGATSHNLKNLCQVPLCIMHGTADKSVPYSASKKVVDSMIAAGDTTRLIFQTLPGASHGALARYFYLPETYKWLLSHCLSDKNRPVSRKYDFSYSVLNNVYNKLKDSKETIHATIMPVTHVKSNVLKFLPHPITPKSSPVYPTPKSETNQ